MGWGCSCSSLCRFSMGLLFKSLAAIFHAFRWQCIMQNCVYFFQANDTTLATRSFCNSIFSHLSRPPSFSILSNLCFSLFLSSNTAKLNNLAFSLKRRDFHCGWCGWCLLSLSYIPGFTGDCNICTLKKLINYAKAYALFIYF